jgi:hypothetical protein
MGSTLQGYGGKSEEPEDGTQKVRGPAGLRTFVNGVRGSR